MSDADGRDEQVWQAGEEERASILGVAKQRLPGYLAVFTVTVILRAGGCHRPVVG